MSSAKTPLVHTSPSKLSLADAMKQFHLVTGGIAGAVSRTLTSPLERIKILRQCQSVEYASLSMANILRQILKGEGWKGFFKGNGTNVIRVIPFSAIEFWSFEVYKSRILLTDKPHHDKARLMLCGSLAGITSALMTYPLDITRTYLTLQTDNLKGSFMYSVRLIYSHLGLFGMYRGISITLVGIAPYVGFKMTTFDILKAKFIPDRSSSTFVVANLCCGAIAATVASTLTYPSDLLRRRIQMIVREIDRPSTKTTLCLTTIHGSVSNTFGRLEVSAGFIKDW